MKENRNMELFELSAQMTITVSKQVAAKSFAEVEEKFTKMQATDFVKIPSGRFQSEDELKLCWITKVDE